MFALYTLIQFIFHSAHPVRPAPPPSMVGQAREAVEGAGDIERRLATGRTAVA